jgi:hypothetical protein
MDNNIISITLENCDGFNIPKELIKLNYTCNPIFYQGVEIHRPKKLECIINSKAFDIIDHNNTLLERLHKISGDIVSFEYLHYNGYIVKIYPHYLLNLDYPYSSNPYQNSKLVNNELIITIKEDLPYEVIKARKYWKRKSTNLLEKDLKTIHKKYKPYLQDFLYNHTDYK